jgi:hypothetical protein
VMASVGSWELQLAPTHRGDDGGARRLHDSSCGAPARVQAAVRKDRRGISSALLRTRMGGASNRDDGASDSTARVDRVGGPQRAAGFPDFK